MNPSEVLEFWKWLELLSFVITLHSDDVFSHGSDFAFYRNYNLHMDKQNSEEKNVVRDFLEKMFADLEECTKNNLSMNLTPSSGDDRAKVKSTIINMNNTLNAVCTDIGDEFLSWELNTQFLSSFSGNKILALQHNEWYLANPFHLEPQGMPRYWSGTCKIGKNPNFESFYKSWRGGDSFFVFTRYG